MTDWKVYTGDGTKDYLDDDGTTKRKANRVKGLGAPPWRDFAKIAERRAETYQPPPDAVEVVNAALYLRRPILVTGQPGTGKTSLIYAVAKELGLGEVLTWPINSRSTLAEGLYRYDAVARLRQAQIDHEARAGEGDDTAARDEQIGRFIKLGPLGTAFNRDRGVPRALLIDEIDKSDVDLPNDLLHVFEDGAFEIPELVRLAADRPEVTVDTSYEKRKTRATIKRGKVRCRIFPFVVITSNGERDLPPAFLRRCLRLDLQYPDADRLSDIVRAHLPDADNDELTDLIGKFRERQEANESLATDQLLNTVFMIAQDPTEIDTLKRILLRALEAR